MGLSRRVVVSVVVCALSSGLFSMAPATASAQTDEASFVQRINDARAAAGVHALQVRDDLTQFARRHSQRMADAGTIYHSSSFNSIDGWTIVGENVGTGPSVKDVHNAFMNSPHHRENILYRDYNQVGIGVAWAAGTVYVTEVFVRRVTTVRDVVAPRRSTRPKLVERVTFTVVRAPEPAIVLTAVGTVINLRKIAEMEGARSVSEARLPAPIEA